MLDIVTKQYIATLIENEFTTIIESHFDKETNILHGIDLKHIKTPHFKFIFEEVIAEKEFDNMLLYLVKLINKNNIPSNIYTKFVKYLKDEDSSIYCIVRESFDEDTFIVNEMVVEKIFAQQKKSKHVDPFKN